MPKQATGDHVWLVKLPEIGSKVIEHELVLGIESESRFMVHDLQFLNSSKLEKILEVDHLGLCLALWVSIVVYWISGWFSGLVERLRVFSDGIGLCVLCLAK